MRVDFLGLRIDNPDLGRTKLEFKPLLSNWFIRGFLVLKQISWDTPARILDKIIAYAVVHAISDCQKGLNGISFGNSLIKQVVTELLLVYSNLDAFVTLSLVPGLKRWLETLSDDDRLNGVASALLVRTAGPELFRYMLAKHLLTAKRSDGLPCERVARLNLGNGAEVHGIHANADTSNNGKT